MSKNNRAIKEWAAKLRLPYIKSYAIEEIKNARVTDMDYTKFLEELLRKEWELREENGKQNRIRRAQFPMKKLLEDLKREELPADARKHWKELETLEFIEEGRNVILAGSPGTGKTHIAIGLGIKACNAGYKVLFSTVPMLINQLKESRSQKTLTSLENKYEKYDVIIADELGYISFDKEGGELLFTHLSLRAERKSTIITTNLSFERWEEIFHDPIMANAMIDRLTHKSYVLNMNGNSYRMKETREWIER